MKIPTFAIIASTLLLSINSARCEVALYSGNINSSTTWGASSYFTNGQTGHFSQTKQKVMRLLDLVEGRPEMVEIHFYEQENGIKKFSVRECSFVYFHVYNHPKGSKTILVNGFANSISAPLTSIESNFIQGRDTPVKISDTKTILLAPILKGTYIDCFYRNEHFIAYWGAPVHNVGAVVTESTELLRLDLNVTQRLNNEGGSFQSALQTLKTHLASQGFVEEID